MHSVENRTNNIRILHLVLFSHSEDYNDMYKLTSPYYKKHHVKTYYYTFSKTIQTDYELHDDILYIKGNESYLPGILDKTIKAFEYIEAYLDEYDYVIRSNISTIINFDLLKKRLIEQPLEYGSGLMFNLHWLDPMNGVVDETHWNKKFASGTSIVLSKQLLKNILIKKQHIYYDLIDDVAIGVIIHDLFKDIIPTDLNDAFVILVNHNGHKQSILQQINQSNYIFYRNRSSDDRKVDVSQMKVILEVLGQNQTNINEEFIENTYGLLCKTPCDINEHLPTLYKYATECESILELGVRGCVSCWALLNGLVKTTNRSNTYF